MTVGTASLISVTLAGMAVLTRKEEKVANSGLPRKSERKLFSSTTALLDYKKEVRKESLSGITPFWVAYL